GTTLTGLRENYNVDPEHFLEYVDDVCLSDLEPDLELVKAISNLSGKKYILTNASDYHAKRILQHLKLNEYFDGVFTIQSANHIPKPEMSYYTQFIEKYNIQPKNSVFFEDSSHNLLTAAELGIKTVLIKTNCEKSMQYHDHIDIHETTDCIKSHLAMYK
ncbi:MAG: putative hydrolase of the HAD superfamily, partial [Francisellaceae bacterium]